MVGSRANSLARARDVYSYITSPNALCASGQSVVLCGANDYVWCVFGFPGVVSSRC